MRRAGAQGLTVSRPIDLSRRDFLKGVFLGRDAARPTEASQDFTTPEVPEWERGMDRVLEAMADMSGIEEP